MLALWWKNEEKTIARYQTFHEIRESDLVLLIFIALNGEAGDSLVNT